MADAIEIYLDMSTPVASAVRGLDDLTAFAFTGFYQGSAVPIRVFPCVRTGNRVTAPFLSKISIDAMSLRVLVGPRAGTTSIKAAQYTWTKQLTADADGKSGYFYADLDLNTSEMNSAISNSETYATYVEFQVSRAGGAWTAVYQAPVTVYATVLDPTLPPSAPTPTTSYMTREECLEMFVWWNNALRPGNAGRNIVLVSPDGTKTREIGVDNNAAPVDNSQ